QRPSCRGVLYGERVAAGDRTACARRKGASRVEDRRRGFQISNRSGVGAQAVTGRSLLAELKRRNVIRMAGLYLVGAWLLTQVASTVFPAFDVPGWALRALIIVL